MGIFNRRRRSYEDSPTTPRRPLAAAQKGSPARAAHPPGAACRICLSDNGALIQPCACRGASTWVHVDCLKRWAIQKEPRVDCWRRCGVCRTPFSGEGAVDLGEAFLGRALRSKPAFVPAARHALGSALLACGERESAAVHLKASLQAKRRNQGDTADVAAVLNDLGIATGDERLFRDALRIYGALDMLETNDAAFARLNRGNALVRRGLYEHASKEYAQALRALEKVHRGDHADVAKALGNLGVIAEYNGDYEEAVAYHLKALNMQRAVFGKDATTNDIANSLENLGVARGRLGDSEAEGHLLASIAMRRTLPAQTRAAVRTLAKLAALRTKTNMDGAQEAYTAARFLLASENGPWVEKQKAALARAAAAVSSSGRLSSLC